MNQILVTEKLYVTPELRRKKKMYKFSFIISIFLVIALISAYAYAQYDRNKSEELSQDILEDIEEKFEVADAQDNTTINKDDKVWVIDLQATQADHYEIEESVTTSISKVSEKDTKQTKIDENRGKYTAPNGKVYNYIGYISIPSIDVKYPILSETSVALLKVSVCRFWGGNPNEVGNLCIAGHNYRNKKFFSKVINLQKGDIIEITDLDKNKVKYKIYDKYTVGPKDVSCTSQLTNGKKIVTLITCTNDSKKRVIVKAEAIK